MIFELFAVACWCTVLGLSVIARNEIIWKTTKTIFD